ncbi:hypothetical protein ACFLR1_04400 [Bacteroidota bacterium]
MDDQVIIELRGNGVVMSLYDIDLETLEFLKTKASRIGEDLSQLWFDPFFWHSPEMHQIKSDVKKVQEYRGLMNDDISFMEIRRKGKKRQKYLVKELLGEGQLFPMVKLIDCPVMISEKETVSKVEMVFGTGNMATYAYLNSAAVNLTELEFFRWESRTEVALCFNMDSTKSNFVSDNYLVRYACLY